MQLQEAASILASLQNRDYTLKELVDIAKKVTNLIKYKFPNASPYESNSYLVDLNKVKVCITYQRKMRLIKLLKKLSSAGGFDKSAAGFIDVAVRPNGDQYIWDGFRRAFMALLSGIDYMPASWLWHASTMTVSECEKQEAKMFKVRNSDIETMKQEEIFRAKVVYDDPEALRFLSFLKDCRLDVENLLPGNKSLGGIVQLWNTWRLQHVSHDNLIISSQILQSAWPKDSVISSYLLCGLGKFLDINEEMDKSFDEEFILKSFKDFINVKPPRKQEELTGRRLNKAPNDSIAYCIAKHVMNEDNTYIKEFLSKSKLKLDDTDVLDEDV
jgi:hypothetical protein